MIIPTTNSTTVAEALKHGAGALLTAGVENSRFEAMLLLIFASSLRREDLVREPERLLSRREQLIFDKALAMRCDRRPLAYITGEQWFYGRPFKINRAVLIPRPETELLVDFAKQTSPVTAADIGTGSGCIAVSIASELPNTSVNAVDIERLALLVAQKNAVRHGVEARVNLVLGDLLAPLDGLSFDLIVSNPPYIRPDDLPGLMPEVREYEPDIALWKGGGDDGMAIHRRLIEGARRLLNPGGWLAMEVGIHQADFVARFAEEYGYKSVSKRPDLGGIDRVVAAQWK